MTDFATPAARLPPLNRPDPYDELCELLEPHEAAPGCEWIAEGVALGNHAAAGCIGSTAQRTKRVAALRRAGITHVVNCAAELACPHEDTFTYLHVRAENRTRTNLRAAWPATTTFVDEALASGGRVLVHGAAGVSRSAATAAAWLVRARGLDASSAIAEIEKTRPFVKPLPAFRAELEAWCAGGVSGSDAAGPVVVKLTCTAPPGASAPSVVDAPPAPAPATPPFSFGVVGGSWVCTGDTTGRRGRA